MRRWRKMTWAIVIWTGLCFLWVFAGLSEASKVTGAGTTAYAAGVTIGVTFIIFVWFLVLIPLALIWFATRPKENVVVYGPAGQQVTVSEKEARRRVEREGWTYRPTDEARSQ